MVLTGEDLTPAPVVGRPYALRRGLNALRPSFAPVVANSRAYSVRAA